jgi:glycosyltransferase involved in cell wall biosynthesis
MKICVITYSFFSHGGVQRVTSTLFNELSLNNQIDILYVGNEKYSKDKLYGLNEDRINIEIKPLKLSFVERIIRKFVTVLNNRFGIFNNKFLCRFLETAIFPRALRNVYIDYLNHKDYDIIIGSEGEIGLLLAAMEDRLKAKTISWQHNSYEAYFNTVRKYMWGREKAAEKLYPKLDAVVALTEDDKQKYKEKMNLQCERIYNPLSFSSSEKSNCLLKNILSVGRLDKQKGFDLLIRAFHKVSTKNKDWKLTIVGEGSDKDDLDNLIEELGISHRINIIGFTNDIKNYYLNSSIYVSSSRWEGFGLVITEAMECGLPVVAFENAGPKEIINNKVDGILVPCEDIEALSNAILELIDNEEKRLEMSKNAIVRAQYFNVSTVSEEWQKLFHKIVK